MPGSEISNPVGFGFTSKMSRFVVARSASSPRLTPYWEWRAGNPLQMLPFTAPWYLGWVPLHHTRTRSRSCTLEIYPAKAVKFGIQIGRIDKNGIFLDTCTLLQELNKLQDSSPSLDGSSSGFCTFIRFLKECQDLITGVEEVVDDVRVSSLLRACRRCCRVLLVTAA